MKESEIYSPQATLAQLESFEIQRKIGSETGTLISFLTGMLSYRSGDFESATARFEQTLAANDMSTFIRQDDLYFNLAYASLQLSKYETSIQYSNKVIEINPQLAAAFNNRGTAYYNLQELDQAYQDFDKAIELYPEYSDAYNNRAAIHAERGRSN